MERWKRKRYMGVGGVKLQRHKVDNDRGEWCLSEDVAELEAENERLRAELERLKAPYKKLSAGEVTAPGWYWWRPNNNYKWSVASVNKSANGAFWFVYIDFSGEDSFAEEPLFGQFIGPLSPPEV